jgi:hypothetical protein
MMAFENIGFTKETEGSLRYLCCAECEIGPLGYALDNLFCIVADRVTYR